MILPRDPLTSKQKQAVMGARRPIFFGAIKWTARCGADASVDSGGYYATYEEAHMVAMARAIERGWTPPKWWQWWRWNDYSPETVGKYL